MKTVPLDEGTLNDVPAIPAVLAPELGDTRQNLLPVAALNAPVRVEFNLWLNSYPMPQAPETLWLYRDGVELTCKQWTAPIALDDLYVEVDMSGWPDGPCQLDYRVRLFNDSFSRSRPMTLTLDRTAPGTGKALTFDPRLTPAGTITDHYLQNHGDQVMTELPETIALLPGDTLSFYWSGVLSPLGIEDEDWVADWRLTAQDLAAPPLTYAFKGEMIRARGDGQRYVYYSVTDRAGNIGDLSRAAVVTVDATPLPRELPPPSVTQATGTPPRQTLAPAAAANGVMVVVPEDAIIYDDERYEVTWGELGKAGGWVSRELPAVIKPWSVAVPASVIGAHVGKAVEVTYKVFYGRNEAVSQANRVSVASLTSGLPAPQCLEAQGMTSLSLSRVPVSGATLRLQRWLLISTDQRVKFTLYGTPHNSGPQELVIVDSHAVSEAEMQTGLTQVLPKAYLESFARNTSITLRVYVSWDRGQTWPSAGRPNFPTQTLLLTD